MKIKTTPSVVIRILIWIIMIFGGLALSIYNDLKEFKSLFFNIYFHLFTFVIGIYLMKLSFHAATVGGKELKRKGREGDLPRLETNKLVTTGIYECTRHPMLFGLTLLPLSFALIIGSPTFIMIIAPLEMIFIIFMVLTLEEAECRKKFGKDYEEYKKKTPIFPKTKECFKKLFFEKIK